MDILIISMKFTNQTLFYCSNYYMVPIVVSKLYRSCNSLPTGDTTKSPKDREVEEEAEEKEEDEQVEKDNGED